jgi:hypothetical protein
MAELELSLELRIAIRSPGPTPSAEHRADSPPEWYGSGRDVITGGDPPERRTATMPATSDGRRQVFCVLGMHRSGTSLLARILNLMGVAWGPPERHLPAQPDNPRGFWEHAEINALNEELLSLMGGGWDDPPVLRRGWEIEPVLGDVKRRAAAVIAGDFGLEPRWGWKDPRNALTLPFWRQLLPSVRCLICVRNPWDVCLSLERRERFTYEKSDRLWLSYNQAALIHTTGSPRLFVFYEDLMDDHVRQLPRIARFVGAEERAERPEVRSAIGAFVDHELQHHRTNLPDALDKPGLSLASRALFFSLRASVGRPPTARSARGAAFEAAFARFAQDCHDARPTVESERRMAARLETREHQLRRAEGLLRARTRESSDALEARERRLGETSEVLEVKERRLRETSTELEEWEGRLARTADAVQQREASLRETAHVLDEQESRLRQTSVVLATQERLVREAADGLRKQEERLRETSDVLQTREEHLRQTSDVLQIQARELRGTHDALRAWEDRLRDKHDVLQAQEGRLRETSAVLQAQEERLLQARGLLEVREKHIGETERELQARAEQCRQATEALRAITASTAYAAVQVAWRFATRLAPPGSGRAGVARAVARRLLRSP